MTGPPKHTADKTPKRRVLLMLLSIQLTAKAPQQWLGDDFYTFRSWPICRGVGTGCYKVGPYQL